MRTPGWVTNILVNHAVHVDVGRSRFSAIASVLSGDARDEAWEAILERLPTMAAFERRAKAPVPVVRIIPHYT